MAHRASSGIGISLRFSRGADGQGREGGSGETGLGLAIASEAIAIHGGTITAQNHRGGGFKVRMVLPLKIAAGRTSVQQCHRELAGSRKMRESPGNKPLLS